VRDYCTGNTKDFFPFETRAINLKASRKTKIFHEEWMVFINCFTKSEIERKKHLFVT